MKNNKRIETEIELLQALEKFLFEEDLIEDVDKDLKDLGYDLDELEKKGREIANVSIANSPFNWRNKSKKEIEVAKINLHKNPIDKSLDRESVVERIQNLLLILGTKKINNVTANFRNLENVSHNDLVNMLEQLEFLASDHLRGE